jgi:hypothetical protein
LFQRVFAMRGPLAAESDACVCAMTQEEGRERLGRTLTRTRKRRVGCKWHVDLQLEHDRFGAIRTGPQGDAGRIGQLNLAAVHCRWRP